MSMAAKLPRVHCELQFDHAAADAGCTNGSAEALPFIVRSDWESSLVSLELEGHPVRFAEDFEHALDLRDGSPRGLDDGVQSDRDGAPRAFRPIRHGQSCDEPLQLGSEVRNEMLRGCGEDIEWDVQIVGDDLARGAVAPR